MKGTVGLSDTLSPSFGSMSEFADLLNANVSAATSNLDKLSCLALNRSANRCRMETKLFVDIARRQLIFNLLTSLFN